MHDALTGHPTYRKLEARRAEAEVTAEAMAEHDQLVTAAYEDALARLNPAAPDVSTVFG